MSYEVIKQIHVLTGILLLVSILTGNNIGIFTIVVVLSSAASAPIIAHVRGVKIDLPMDRHGRIVYSASWSDPAILWIALNKCPVCQLAPCGGCCSQSPSTKKKSDINHQYILECADRFREKELK